MTDKRLIDARRIDRDLVSNKRTISDNNSIVLVRDNCLNGGYVPHSA